MTPLNKVLETAMRLDFYSREMLLEILQKRQIEDRRKEIAKNAKSAKATFRKGKIKSGSANDAIKLLNDLL